MLGFTNIDTLKLAQFFFKWQLVIYKRKKKIKANSISIHFKGKMNFKQVYLSPVAFEIWFPLVVKQWTIAQH